MSKLKQSDKPTLGATYKGQKILWGDPKDLKPHPWSSNFYGDAPDDAFVAKVAQYGITSPLQAMLEGDGTLRLISGHRRRQAAILNKIKQVPFIIRSDIDPADDLAVHEVIVVANQYRDKTTEVKAREFQVLLEIEAAKAEKRQLETLR